MSTESPPSSVGSGNTVAAGMLAPWQTGELPEPPASSWRLWAGLIGPGVLMAGASIGTGEWLFGPAVSAQYGATLLWLATISIVCQVFLNLEVMRYALYCGEPVMVGYFRTWPGPVVWTVVYALLDFSAIWPYNASNAAVPLAAAILGHLPGGDPAHLLGWTFPESDLVKGLGFVIFLAAFLPLIFGGTIYRMLERVFTVKLVIVLCYLCFFGLFTVSRSNAREVVAGFLRFGTVPIRADTVVVGRHFTLLERDGATSYTVQGTVERGQHLVTGFVVKNENEVHSFAMGKDVNLVTGFVVKNENEVHSFAMGKDVPADLAAVRDRLVERARGITERAGFTIQTSSGDATRPATLTIEGEIDPDRSWRTRRVVIQDSGAERTFHRLEDVPEPEAGRARVLLANQGIEPVFLPSYVRDHGRLPDLNWPVLAAFFSIAGAGGLTNCMFSNYARDKGWGMGARVGAIPSAVGGRLISLSHVGRVFPVQQATRPLWRGWIRHIVRDQMAIWMLCSFIGMALPCMLSLEFIRHAPVEGNRVAAMTAQGMADRFPAFEQLIWSCSLLVAFLVLAPGQIMSGDLLARRWTDIIWTSSKRAHQLSGNQVKYIYYAILAVYCAWGLVTLALFDPLKIATIGAVLQNVSLSVSALHTVYVNRTLLPRELQARWWMQAGVLCCGLIFLAVSLVVLVTL